jgi:hypothetical protein
MPRGCCIHVFDVKKAPLRLNLRCRAPASNAGKTKLKRLTVDYSDIRDEN